MEQVLALFQQNHSILHLVVQEADRALTQIGHHMYRGGLLIKHALYNFVWDRPVPFEIDRGILMGLRNGK